MTHPIRPLAAGLTLHATAQAIPNRLCFPDEDSRGCLLQRLSGLRRDLEIDLHAYAMMDNHLHVLLSARQDLVLAAFMQRLLSWHARLCNRREGTRGPMWDDRYKCVIIEESDHLLNSYLYIDANPWRAFVVDHPRDNRWTSYHENALGSGHAILTPPAMIALGPDPESRQKRYCSLMEAYLHTAIRVRSHASGAAEPDPLAGLRLCEIRAV